MKRYTGVMSAGIVLALLVAVVALWNWDWFAPLLAAQAGRIIDRKVTLAHLQILDLFSGKPVIELDGLTIGNPPDFPDGSRFGSVDKISVQIDLATFIQTKGQQLIIPAVLLDHPQGDLGIGPKGHENWAFALPASSTQSTDPSSSSGFQMPTPTIGAVLINQGDFHFVDPRFKTDLHVKMNTRGRSATDAKLVADITGTYNAQPFTAHIDGGALVSLRDEHAPYPIDITAQAGQTKITLKGTVADPTHFAGANIQLDLSGQDLADLYKIVGIPLPPTTPYRLAGHLDYRQGKIRFTNFTGTVGRSDLAGEFDVDITKDVTTIQADLTSKDVDLRDLGGFIGAAPGAKTDAKSATQQAKQAQQDQSGMLFPDTPINLPDLSNVNFKVHYKGSRIEGESMPLDNVDATLDIDKGQIRLTPLSFGVGGGAIVSTIAIDNITAGGRGNQLHAKADVDFRQVDLQRLMKATHAFDGFGTIGGRATIEGNGDSLAKIMGSGNGNLKLFMDGGDISALLVNLAGLDLGRSLLSFLKLPDHANINCMISDFALTNGVLDTRTFVLDTSEANILGKGTINLQNETIDYQVTQDPKHFSIGAIHAPIDVTGPLKNPSVGLDPKVLAARGAAAGVLGVLLTPIAALIPTIQLGLGTKNTACQDLLAPAKAEAAAPPPQQPKRSAVGPKKRTTTSSRR